ncbi:hypothetical protein LTR04_003231 [Oleoguttula sp. CCFEE 6159]|nr:hypothetical protein LTR04_003231 [Oleoguttula sp. CCFEE 6159]
MLFYTNSDAEHGDFKGLKVAVSIAHITQLEEQYEHFTQDLNRVLQKCQAECQQLTASFTDRMHESLKDFRLKATQLNKAAVLADDLLKTLYCSDTKTETNDRMMRILE